MAKPSRKEYAMNVFTFFVLARNDKVKDGKEEIIVDGSMLADDSEDAKLSIAMDNAEDIKAAKEKGKVDILVSNFCG